MAAKDIIKLLPIQLAAKWVKRYSTSKNKTPQEEMNIHADMLAADYASFPHPKHVPKPMPLIRPGYKVRLIHNGSPITTKLYKTLLKAKHSSTLQRHVQKKGNWSGNIFAQINWSAHERAFSSLLRQKIVTSKMLHHLMNTSCQNKLYYGSLDQCPYCNRAAESFSHVLSCCDPSAATDRDSAFTQLMTALSNIKTPLLIIEAIKHGTKHWLDPGSIRVRALTAGSLHPGDTLLTTAFQEQFHNIGWYHLFLG
jgi:hypothetical protein